MSLVKEGERVAVFIDAQFLINGLNVTCPGQRFDFHGIVNKLVSPGRITRAWYYNAPPPPYLSAGKKRSSAAMEARIAGLPFFEVVHGRLQARERKVIPKGKTTPILATYWEQKGVDVKLSIDMISKAQRNEYDTAILISGDGDFVELVKLVKAMGKHVVNATCPPNRKRRYQFSGLLRQACDGCVVMDAAFLADCLLERPEAQWLTELVDGVEALK